MVRKKAILFIVIFAVYMVLPSCFTVKYSFSGASIPPDMKTCSVQYFQNRAQRIEPMLAQQLTDALKDKIQGQTRLTLVNGIGDADFEGVITDFKETYSAVSKGDVASQNRFTITVKVTYSNALDPETDYDKTFSRYIDYASTTSFELAISTYTEDLLVLIIEDIFNEAFANW